MGLYQYDSTEDKLNLVAGSTNFSDAPVGAIFPFGGTDIPISFLLCDGSAVSRTDYEDLFNVIGTAFGTGDGSTTFNLPDLREAVPKGAGLTGKTVGAHLDADGLAVGEFLDDRVENISGSYDARVMRSGSTDYDIVVDPQGAFKVSDKPGASYGYVNSSGQTTKINHITFDSSNVARTGDTTEVKSVGVNYIIKAKQIGMPTDFASAVGDIVVDKNTYSTSETIVGKWVDGKPVYQRTIAVTSPNTTAETNVSIAELGFTNIDKIFITSPSYIYLYINNMNQHVPISLGWGSGDLGIIPATDDSHNGYLVWKVGNSAWISKNGYVTLMYTKTTD